MTNDHKQKKLFVMAGGTGGHIFPALAVANELQKRGWQIRWLGTADRMEAILVPANGIDIDFIKISGIRGKGLKAKLLAPLQIFRAIFQAKKYINAYKPNAVLGMGGYVSGPGGVAAKLSGVPVILHEQNGVAGLTNKWLSYFAKVTLQAFPGAFRHAEVVGNPVRESLENLPSPQVRYADRTGPLHILVVGGSQGAQILNNIIPGVAIALADRAVFWHQVGKNNLEKTVNLYGNAANQHKIVEFIDNMDDAYAWADLVICRSGALTVSEISVVGLAAIFVPFQHKDRQQYWNAKPLEEIGAGIIIEQPEFTHEKLMTQLQGMDRECLSEMAIKAKSTQIVHSAKRVADIIEQNSK